MQYFYYGVGDDVQTPEMTATNISKFKNVENIPFNIEKTPTSVKGTQSSAGDSGIQASGGDTSSSGSGKRSFIDLDDYEQDDEAKKTKLVEVKIEPEE
jgi:hypothetical protein